MFSRKSKAKAAAAATAAAAAAAADTKSSSPGGGGGGGVERGDSVKSNKKSAQLDSQRGSTPPEVPPGAGGKQPDRKTKAAKSGQAMVMWAGGEAAATGVSTALVAVGVSSVIAPVVAVIVLVGHVIIKGTALAVNKRLQVRSDQKAHLEDLSLTEARAADHFTIFINGTGAPGECSAYVSSTDYLSHPPVNPGALNGISKLVSGSSKCNVRDMGGFTENLPTPFNVRISMPDVIALMRQSWTYERFCQTKCKSMTIVVLRSQHSKAKLRVAWENSGTHDCCKAKVYTAEEWKKTPFAGKTTTMPEKVADVDMALDRTLVFE